MKNKTFVVLCLLLCSVAASAQWRAGVTAGATCNHYVYDRQYMTDYVNKDRWGVTLGVSGQYNFTGRFGRVAVDTFAFLCRACAEGY